jgi:glycosyltransferase involved in cell wall biosynthesis
MKVLLCTRQDYNRNFSGDSMLVLKTAKYLAKCNVDVDINNGSVCDYSKYDIVHLFNLTRVGETYKYYKIAKYYKKNIVLSPIYWDMGKYYEYVKDIENIKLWNRCNAYRAEIIKGCKMIYANSNMEVDMLMKHFSTNTAFNVNYYGVEVENEDIPLYSLKHRYELDNYVLCVGRICKIKNQLELVKACNELGIKVVLIGNIADKKYYLECIKYENVIYLGFIDSYNIYNAYRFSKLHVLPGFVETPGFSSLEAAACGCKIVTTSEGCAKEYFEDKAVYCNPYNFDSLVKAVQIAYNQKKNDDLKDMVLQKYTWDKYIEKLCSSYKDILSL